MRYAGDTQPDDLACTLDAEGHEPARIEHVRFSPERAALIKSDVDVAFRQEVCRSSPASRCLSLLQAGSVRSASARVSTSTNTRSWLESAQNFQGDMTEGFPHVMRMFSADAGSILAVADGESELLYAVFMILVCSSLFRAFCCSQCRGPDAKLSLGWVPALSPGSSLRACVC